MPQLVHKHVIHYLNLTETMSEERQKPYRETDSIRFFMSFRLEDDLIIINNTLVPPFAFLPCYFLYRLM